MVFQVCPQARIFVNLKGVVIAEHEPVKRWETTRYLQVMFVANENIRN